MAQPPSSPQAYIDFEIGEGNREGARELYERLLQRTQHVKVRGAGSTACSAQRAACGGLLLARRPTGPLVLS